MKKITILSLHLNYGGVEKAITNLANMLTNNYKVEIICVYQIIDKPVFKLDDRVEIKYLLDNIQPNREKLKDAIKRRNLINIFKEGLKSIKVLYLRKKRMVAFIKNCNSDIIISSRLLFTEWLSKYGNHNTIKIAQEHSHHNDNGKYIKKVIKSCVNIDYFMPVSKELTRFYESKLTGKTKCVYIPHALDNYEYKLSNLKEPNLISIGRLSPEKGFLDLIEIFFEIKDKYPEAKLHIVGDGIKKNEILNKINEYDLLDNVVMHGFQRKEYINKLLSESSIYLMSSYEESFGIVLLEASIHGLPLIAFSSAQGANEIIKNEYNGYLIKNRDHKKFSEIVIKLLSDYQKRIKIGKNSYESAKKYKYEVIEKENLLFFEKIVESNRNELPEVNK